MSEKQRSLKNLLQKETNFIFNSAWTKTAGGAYDSSYRDNCILVRKKRKFTSSKKKNYSASLLQPFRRQSSRKRAKRNYSFFTPFISLDPKKKEVCEKTSNFFDKIKVLSQKRKTF
jgi:hypothetical protein